MARRRFIPKYVTVFTDRHGKKRYRYRRAGYEGGYFKSDLGTDEFRAEYAAFGEKRKDPGTIGWKPPTNSVDDVITRYVAEPTRLGQKLVTQQKVRAILDRFRTRYGNGKSGPRYLSDFNFEHIDKIIQSEREKKLEGKRMVGGVEAARKLRKELVRLFDFAEKIKAREQGTNPVRQAQKIKTPANAKKGHHTWSEAEIAQYRARHPLGTNARLALELFLWTGQRRGDGFLFGPQSVVDGCFEFTQEKTGKNMLLPLAPQLVEAITAMPPLPPGATAYLLSNKGTPYTYATFGNKMQEWTAQAGLKGCSAHGLRKANARRLAELEAPNQMIKAVGGWTNDDEVALYTRDAEQSRLAASAIKLLAAWESNRVSNRECLTNEQGG